MCSHLYEVSDVIERCPRDPRIQLQLWEVVLREHGFDILIPFWLSSGERLIRLV